MTHPYCRLAMALAILCIWDANVCAVPCSAMGPSLWIGEPVLTLVSGDPLPERKTAPQVSYELSSGSTGKDYSFLFSGQLHCGAVPCREATVHLVVTTPGASELEQAVMTDAEGHYTLT